MSEAEADCPSAYHVSDESHWCLNSVSAVSNWLSDTGSGLVVDWWWTGGLVANTCIDVSNRFIDVSNMFMDVSNTFIDVSNRCIDVSNRFIDVSNRFI
jgi:hypothetical protein